MYISVYNLIILIITMPISEEFMKETEALFPDFNQEDISWAIDEIEAIDNIREEWQEPDASLFIQTIENIAWDFALASGDEKLQAIKILLW